MMATRLLHKEVDAMFNKLSQDRRSRPWKRGEPDPDSSQTNMNSTTHPNAPTPKATGVAAGSAPPPRTSPPGFILDGGTKKNTSAVADSEKPTNPKENPLSKSQPVQIF